jgi:hypothetical protein
MSQTDVKEAMRERYSQGGAARGAKGARAAMSAFVRAVKPKKTCCCS